MLDKLVTEYEESITNQLEDFKKTVGEALGIANDNTAKSNAYLAAIAKSNGYEIKDEVDLENIKKVINEKTTDIKDSATDNPNNSNDNSNGNHGNNYGDEPKYDPPKEVVSDKPASTSVEKEPNVVDLTKLKKVEDIFGNEKYYAKGKKSKASDYKTEINRYLFKKNGKVLSDAGLKALREALGVKKNSELYNAMVAFKKQVGGNIKNVGGFKTGGIAKLVKSRGEDGLMLARNGEGFVSPEHVPAIQELLDTVPLMNNMFKPLVEAPKLPNLTPVNNAANNILQIDTLTLPNVTNYEEFRDSMYKDMQSNKKFEGMIRDMSINQVSGGGRLSKYNKRF